MEQLTAAQAREADIEDVKTFVSMVRVAKEDIQWKGLQAQAGRIRELLENLLPQLTEIEDEDPVPSDQHPFIPSYE